MTNLASKLANFKNLKEREKLLIIGLALAVFVSLYFQIFYRPLSGKISRYRSSVQKAQGRFKELTSRFPSLEEQRQNIQSLDSQCQQLLAEITRMEEKLPGKKNSSQFLSQLTKLSKGVKINSVRQKIETGEEYSRIFFEIKFDAPYKETLNYLSRLQALSPFLNIEELEISPSKNGEDSGGPSGRLILSTLLSETSTAEIIRASEEPEAIPVGRDIFVSKARPVTAIRETELKLEGVTYSPQGSTAIVNGDVVRVGSKIGNFTVKEIRPNEVVLTDGVQEHVLLVER